MSEPSTIGLDAESSAGARPRSPAAVLAALLLATLALEAWRRGLTADEARFLVEGSPAGAARVQAVWTHWAGRLPGGARALGVLSVALGLAVLGLASARRAGAAAGAAAILVPLALPATHALSGGIGGAAPVVLAVAALVALAATLAPRVAAARLAAVGALADAAMPWLPFTRDFGGSALGVADFGSPRVAVLATVAPTALAALALAWRAGSHRVPALGAWLVLGASLAAAALTRGTETLAPALAGAIALLGLAASGDPAAAGGRLALTAALPAALLAAIFLGFLPDRGPPGREATELPRVRADLDWLTFHVDQGALLVHCGETAAMARYLEGAGHRTGHVSLAARVPSDLDDLRAFTDLNRIGTVAVTGGFGGLRSEDEARLARLLPGWLLRRPPERPEVLVLRRP
ncbi:MAG: hypothetical protein R3F20_00415 [Planctomycetota bacterium]